MAATVGMCKPVEAPLVVKEQRPKRDFLREHREYLRNIQKVQRTAKTRSAKSSGALSRDTGASVISAKRRPEGTVNDTWKSEAFNRSPTKMDRAKHPVDKRFGTFISRSMEPRKRGGALSASPTMLDEYVQTCDPELDSFLDGARILTPSDFVLEAIRAKNEPPPPEPEPKPRPVRRRIDRHTCVLNAHLSDLKEFLEKGSVSRRKRNETQKNPNIQKYLTRGRLNLRSRNSRPSIELGAKKAVTENRIMENIRSSIYFGAGESAGKPVVKAPKQQPRITRKEAIGDGPKRSEGNKLIVVYQKD